MTELIWVVFSLASVVLVSIATIAVMVRVVYKRNRRSRALTGAALRARARLSWGPQHEVLKLRLRLAQVLDSGQAAVDLALRGGGPRGDLPRLFRRIQIEAAALESQLRLLASESDSVVLAQELPVAARRVGQVAGMVHRLRSAVAAGLGDLTDDALLALRSEVDREVAALNAGAQELHALNGNDGSSDPHRQLSMDRLKKGNES